MDLPRTLVMAAVASALIGLVGCGQSVSAEPSGLRGAPTKEKCDLSYSPVSDWVFPQEPLVEADICELTPNEVEVTVTSAEKLAALRSVLSAPDEPAAPDQPCSLEAEAPLGVAVLTAAGMRVAAHIPRTVCSKYQSAPRDLLRSLLPANS